MEREKGEKGEGKLSRMWREMFVYSLISDSTPLSFFKHLVFLYLPFYIPFPQPFYALNILAAELLVYCSQLLTVAEGNNGNDPLNQFLNHYQNITWPNQKNSPKQPREDNSQSWQHKGMHVSVFLFHRPSRRGSCFPLQQPLIAVFITAPICWVSVCTALLSTRPCSNFESKTKEKQTLLSLFFPSQLLFLNQKMSQFCFGTQPK